MKFSEMVKGRPAEMGERSMVEHFPRIVCKDDFSVSVQASNFNYSSPRDNVGPYTHMELGFPSAIPTAEIMEYAETPDNPLGTVYGYVPIELIERLILIHGGQKD